LGTVVSGHQGCKAFDRRGRELRLTARPRLLYLANHITTKRKDILATPPQPHVRKKLEPEVPQGTIGQPSST
jgi:hypothetical protein